MKNLISTTCLIFIIAMSLSAQEKLEVDGKVKITEMAPSDSDSIVVWGVDKTLSMRSASSLSEKQILSISNDTIYLSGGEFVKLPAEVDGDVTNEKISGFGIVGDSLYIKEGSMDTMKVGIATKSYVDGAISAALGSSTMAVEDFGIKYATKSGIRGLIGEGYDIGDLIGLGVDTVELVAYVLIDSLIAGGASLSDIRGAGVSVQQLLTAGVRPDSIYNIGVSIDSLYGKTYGGGLIFYLDTQDTIVNLVGLVAAPYGWYNGGADPTVQWGCVGTTISGADGTAIGTGDQNTIDIEAGCLTVNTSADISRNAQINGFGDWYLPSKDELYEMYLKLKVKDLGGFSDNAYWSSTEHQVNLALYLDFTNGNSFATNKDYNGASVRCVRGF